MFYHGLDMASFKSSSGRHLLAGRAYIISNAPSFIFSHFSKSCQLVQNLWNSEDSSLFLLQFMMSNRSRIWICRDMSLTAPRTVAAVAAVAAALRCWRAPLGDEDGCAPIRPGGASRNAQLCRVVWFIWLKGCWNAWTSLCQVAVAIENLGFEVLSQSHNKVQGFNMPWHLKNTHTQQPWADARLHMRMTSSIAIRVSVYVRIYIYISPCMYHRQNAIYIYAVYTHEITWVFEYCIVSSPPF
jgi:hypothetical protein